MVVLLISLTLIGFITGVRHYAEEGKRQAAYSTAKTFQDSIGVLHEYYSREIEPRARAAGVEFSVDFDKTPDKFPYPATLSIKFGEALRDLNPILSTSLYSRTPFPNRKDRVLDRFEEESLTYLETNPKSEFYRIEQIGGRKS